MTKSFQNLFSRKYSIDLNDISATNTITSMSNSNAASRRAANIGNSGSNNSNNNNNGNSNSANNNNNPLMNQMNKHYNTVTGSNVILTASENEMLNQIFTDYSKLTYYDQYSIVNKIAAHIIDLYKSLDVKNYLPKLQYIQFIFDLMESNMNIFNLLLFSIRLLHVGPIVEKYMRNKFLPHLNHNNGSSSNKIYYFEYVSHFYLNIIGVLRLHLISLVLWKDLATEVFKWY